VILEFLDVYAQDRPCENFGDLLPSDWFLRFSHHSLVVKLADIGDLE
jgi:hypothetical protein